ncbi:MAG: hypothetical protein ACFFA6_14085 [Promethearchaeota archaeon]
MLKIELKNKRKPEDKVILCYNCGMEINDQAQKFCPNCHIILNPNDYIKWKKSWYGFLCCLCLLPLLIVFLICLITF